MRSPVACLLGSVPTISVIIPTLEEAEHLEGAILSFSRDLVDEILVVDGGSADETRDVAEQAGARVAVAPTPGRARQQNLGASLASGSVLLFSHGDTWLNDEALIQLRERLMRDEELLGGAFARRFDSKSAFLSWSCRLADWRGRRFGWFLGDQSLFVRKDVFHDLGGFDEEMGPGEDLDFSVRMAAAGKTALIEPAIVSSARRFERRGSVGQTVRDFRAGWQIMQRARRKGTEGEVRLARDEA